MKKLINAIMLIVFVGANNYSPLRAALGESCFRVQTPAEDGQADVVAAAMGGAKFTKVPDTFVNAQAAGEAEKAAQELLAWAEWELSGNTEPNPHAPPKWGERLGEDGVNLTPEVARELVRIVIARSEVLSEANDEATKQSPRARRLLRSLRSLAQ